MCSNLNGELPLSEYKFIYKSHRRNIIDIRRVSVSVRIYHMGNSFTWKHPHTNPLSAVVRSFVHRIYLLQIDSQKTMIMSLMIFSYHFEHTFLNQYWKAGGMTRRNHDDVIKWKHFPRYWPFVRGIHRSPVNSPHKGQWRGALKFSLICARINRWVNNREAGDRRRHQAHCDVIVMYSGKWMPEKKTDARKENWIIMIATSHEHGTSIVCSRAFFRLTKQWCGKRFPVMALSWFAW